MRNFKKILALLLSITMVLGLGVAAFAVDNSHTITIKNSDANGEHTYEAYQVFKGNLNATEEILSDIEWGSGVDGEAILAALVDANAAEGTLKGKFATLTKGAAAQETAGQEGYVPAVPASTAADVAELIAKLGDNSAELDAVARIIGDHLGATKYAFSGNKTAGYTATVPTDGYYFIKDTTAVLTNGDTASKYILNVVKDVTINAKDDSLTPDKNIIDEQNNRLKAIAEAMGKEQKFEVTIDVPDTTNFNYYKFIMNDQLPAGLTFTGIDSVSIAGTPAVTVVDKNTVTGTLDNSGATAYYELEVNDAAPTYNSGYAWDAEDYDAVTAQGGQKISVIFKYFKNVAEYDRDATADGTQNVIGKKITITYTAVINDDATYGMKFNKNDVSFDFPNDPNTDYDNTTDKFGEEETHGTTPHSTTETYVTSIELEKYTLEGSTEKKLEGAEFTIKSQEFNTVIKTGVKFEKKPYPAEGATLPTGEKVETGEYYKLKDGTYTTTVPGEQVKDDNGNPLYVDPDGNITTSATTPNPEAGGTPINNTPYVYNTTQYESIQDKYVKVSYTLVEKAPQNKTYTLITDANGLASVSGLKPGVYDIEETKAPDGYNLLDYTIQLTIGWVDVDNVRRNAQAAATETADDTADTFITADIQAQLDKLTGLGIATVTDALTQAKSHGGFFVAKAVRIDKADKTETAAETTFNLTYKTDATDEGGEYHLKVLNNSGTELPSTGGIGTTIFYIVGGLLAVGAGVVLVSKKRMGKVDD